MLKVDPMERYSIDDIKASDWFSKDLSDDLFPECPGIDLLDEEAVAETVEKFGVEPNDVLSAIENQDIHSHLYIAYRLILDNRTTANKWTASERQKLR